MNYKIKYQKGGFNYDSTSSSDSELDTLSSEKDYKTQQLKIPIIYFDFFMKTFNKTIQTQPIAIDPKCIRTDADIYNAVNVLAREVTRWTLVCDKRLHRLICYIHHESHLVLTCFLGLFECPWCF